MSRSYKRQPYKPHPLGYGGDSEKEDKRIWHGKMRAHCRIRIQQALLMPEIDVFLPSIHQVGDVREMIKEGKVRFDPREEPELLRK